MATSETIKEKLERASETVSQRPSIGQRVYRNTATIEDGLTCRVSEKNHSVVVDVPKSMGGEEDGPSPSFLIRGALTSCVAIGLKMWAARQGVTVDRIDVSVETDVDARGQLGVCDTAAPGFEGIRLVVQVDSPAPRAMLEDLLETSLRYSPLIDVVGKPQTIETSLVVTETV